MITVTILTKNNENTLKATLQSIKIFDEVIILDTGSNDATPKIATLYSNVRIFHSPFIGLGPLQNLAASYATHEWILSLDSDEVLTEELSEEILSLQLNPHYE